MNIKTVPMSKKDVETLSDDQLSILIEWGGSDGFQIARKLGEEFLQRRNKTEMDMIEGSPFEEIGRRMAAIAQVKLGIDYFLDCIQRAKEEIDERKRLDKKKK